MFAACLLLFFGHGPQAHPIKPKAKPQAPAATKPSAPSEPEFDPTLPITILPIAGS
jgi:hypothetical protein